MPRHCCALYCINNDGFHHCALRLLHYDSDGCTACCRLYPTTETSPAPLAPALSPFHLRTFPQPLSQFISRCPFARLPGPLHGHKEAAKGQKWPQEAAKPSNWFQEAAKIPNWAQRHCQKPKTRSKRLPQPQNAKWDPQKSLKAIKIHWMFHHPHTWQCFIKFEH